MIKSFIAVSVLLTGCTTVYKVDEKGICRDPKGKIVPIPEVDLPKWACGEHWAKPIAGNQIYVNGGSWWGQKAGTCCGW
jgi:hypothetical protein